MHHQHTSHDLLAAFSIIDELLVDFHLQNNPDIVTRMYEVMTGITILSETKTADKQRQMEKAEIWQTPCVRGLVTSMRHVSPKGL
jgi:hypothetical protein